MYIVSEQVLQAAMDEPMRRQEPLALSPQLPACPSTPLSDHSAHSLPATSPQCSHQSSFLTSDDHFLTPDQTPRSAVAHSRVSLLVQSTNSSFQVPPHSNINLQDLSLLLSPASYDSPSSSKRTSSLSRSSSTSSIQMSSLQDLVNTDDAAILEPTTRLSSGNLYQSDEVFGLSSPSPHSHSTRFSSTRASVSSRIPDQDAFAYRYIGPAIVLKSYQPKNSSVDLAFGTSCREDSSQSGGSDKHSLRAPFIYSVDSIYAELGLVEPDQYNPVDGGQMTPLLQFDQDSLDTQVEQSYRTAVTNTSCPVLTYADEFLHSSNSITELTNQPSSRDQRDFLSEDVILFPASPNTQPHADSSVSNLIPPLLPGEPHKNGCTELLLPDDVMQASAPLKNSASEHEPSSFLPNSSTAQSDDTSAPALLPGVQTASLCLDHIEPPRENSLKILVPTTETLVHEKPAPLISRMTDISNGPEKDSDSALLHGEEHNTLTVNYSESSQIDAVVDACVINCQHEVESKPDDQVTIKSTVIRSSHPTSTVDLSASQFEHETGADSSTLSETSGLPNPAFTINDLKTGLTSSVDYTPEVLSLDPPPFSVADNAVVSTGLTTLEEGDATTDAGTITLPCNLAALVGTPAQARENPEFTSSALVASDVPPFQEINGIEENITAAPEKKRANTTTAPEVADSAHNGKNFVPSGKDTTSSMEKASSNDPAEKTQISTSISSLQARRMRSISGFFKTLNKKPSVKADVLKSCGSASAESSEEDKRAPAAQVLPKRKSLSSLKVKARLSSFYRSPDQPVPTIPQARDPSRISEEKREVIVKVEDKTAPLKNYETVSPSTPQDQEQPSQAIQTMNPLTSPDEVKASRITHHYKISRAKRGFRSRSQTILPPSTCAVDNLDKPFVSVAGEIGSNPFSRPKTLRKKRTLNHQLSTPVLKDITLSGLISKLLRKNNRKAGPA